MVHTIDDEDIFDYETDFFLSLAVNGESRQPEREGALINSGDDGRQRGRRPPAPGGRRVRGRAERFRGRRPPA